MNLKTFFHSFICGLILCTQTSPTQNLVGKKAPVFNAQAAFPDGCICDLNLQDYIGRYDIVLYFYPMDNTPGCSKQAQIFRDNIEKLKQHNIIVIAVSCDSITSHQKFQKKYQLPFPIVSDSRWNQTIGKLYGANGWFYSQRKTFLINTKGIIIKQFDKVDIQNQMEDILEIFTHQTTK